MSSLLNSCSHSGIFFVYQRYLHRSDRRFHYVEGPGLVGGLFGLYHDHTQSNYNKSLKAAILRDIHSKMTVVGRLPRNIT